MTSSKVYIFKDNSTNSIISGVDMIKLSTENMGMGHITWKKDLFYPFLHVYNAVVRSGFHVRYKQRGK